MRVKEPMEKYELPGPYIEAGKHLFTITFVRHDLQNKTRWMQK